MGTSTSTKLLTLVMNLVALTEQKAAAQTRLDVLAPLLSKGDLSDEVKDALERQINQAEDTLHRLHRYASCSISLLNALFRRKSERLLLAFQYFSQS